MCERAEAQVWQQMSKAHEDQPLVASVLDRLLDDHPEQQHELPKARHQLLRELKQSVRRDLENLLNTRWRCVSWPPNLDELELSLVNYGIPDFTGVNMASPAERERLRRLIEQIVRKFEPRFKTVKVIMLANRDETDRTLRFRIDAMLYAEPAPEPVIFDSELEPITNSFNVASESR
jgi:type VI secretion system protein ImpF